MSTVTTANAGTATPSAAPPATATPTTAMPAPFGGRQPLTRAAYASRTGRAVPTPEVRIVHLGLGAFHRAHQAWFTSAVDDRAEWGIAAFTGRNPSAAEELAPQDGLFTVLERSESGDTATVVTSIVDAVDGADLTRLVQLLAAPTTAIVTLTVTEAGYRLTPTGSPNLNDSAVAADVAGLRSALEADQVPASSGGPSTTLGRLVLGLDARRRAQAGPIAVVPCDNIPDNGAFVRAGVLAFAALVSAATAEWIDTNVSFVSTSVDRITPRTTSADLDTVAALTGWEDHAAVVTEPFTDWVLSGNFPAGRPAWEKAGARFVDEIEPFERRKLWLLNGAHTLLAYAGRLRGHETVAAAMADPVCRGWVNDFWDAAERHLPAGLDLPSYRAALISRFDNARIEHQLAQISNEGVTKLRVRILPTVLAERSAGRDGGAGLRAIGCWVALVLSGQPLLDADAEAIGAASAEPTQEWAIDALLRLLDPLLVTDSALREELHIVVAESVPR